MGVLSTAWLILKKDLLSELRTREVIATMGIFSVLVVVIFAFAFSVDETRGRLVAAGIVWVVVLFASTLGLSRIFDQERDNGGLVALCLSPAGPVAVYIAKVTAIVIFSLLTELFTIPLMLVFLGVSIPDGGIGLLTVALVLGTLGVAEIGTLFGGMLANARMREVLLPLLVYPVTLPVVIAGVELTEIAFGGGMPDAQLGWIKLMIGFDLIFAIIPGWVFGRVMLD